MAKSAILNIEIVAQAKEAIEQFDKVKEKASGTHTALRAGALLAAGAIIGGLAAATKAAVDHEANVAKLDQAYKNAGVSTKDMGGALDDIEKSTRRTGQSTEDAITAYTHLVTATRNAGKAHSELATAEDLAAYKGVSVTDAADAITKASHGNTRALKEMGIATTDAAGKQLPAAALMKQLEQAVHGQADAFGNTAAGQMARYRETLDQTKEKIGAALLPALQQLLGILQPVFAWLAQNTAVVRVLVPILGALAAVVLVVSAVSRVWLAIQMVLNVVMSANPIGLIILAIAALIAVIVLVVKHWNDVLWVVNVVWGALRAVGAWIVSNWPKIVLAMLGPIGWLVIALGGPKKALDDLIAALAKVGDAVSKALGWLGKLPSSAGGLLSKLNPFSLPGGSAPAPAPMVIQIFATPGDDLPQVVYDAMRRYQRQHARPELRPMFG